MVAKAAPLVAALVGALEAASAEGCQVLLTSQCQAALEAPSAFVVLLSKL